MNTLVYFSATDTTKRVVEAIAREWGEESRAYDLTRPCGEDLDAALLEGTVVIGVPVYAGRVPALAAERLKHVHGNGQKAVAVCVYGNRAYDDALVELCDIAEAQGFRLVAAGAFVAEHCIFPKVAAARPDAADMDKIKQFAALCKQRVQSGTLLDAHLVKGNRPYLKPAGVPLHPKADRALCVQCGTCARECPVGAISAAEPYRTDTSKCITCCRCIHVCPHGARHFGGLLYKIAGWKFTRDNAPRREPEWF